MILGAIILSLFYFTAIYLLARDQYQMRRKHYVTKRITYGRLAVIKRKLQELESRPPQVQKFYGVKKKTKPLLPKAAAAQLSEFAQEQTKLAEAANAIRAQRKDRIQVWQERAMEREV